MNKSRNTRNYSKRYGNALKGVPTLDQKELAVKTKDGLKKIHPLDVRHEGYTFGTVVDLYQEEVIRNENLRNELKEAIEDLTSVLIQKGYNTPNTDLKSLIGDIGHLLIIEPNKQYHNFILDELGYVIGRQNVEVVEDYLIDVPEDFNKGYYKIDNHKFVLDEERYAQYWSVMS